MRYKFGNLDVIFFPLFLLLALLFTGCAQKALVPDNNVSWQNEVKYATECGMDGLRCCTDTDPSCLYNQQCCVNPDNPNDNFCSDDCTCGQEKKFCCPGGKCETGLSCLDSRCVKCGEKNEPCCGNSICDGNLLCYQGKCVPCGLTNNPCCGLEPLCAGGEIGSGRVECLNDLCRLCGANGNVACSSDPKCDKKQLANNGICLACGEFNNPCCNEGSRVGFDCNPASGLVCKLGFCDKK